MVMQSMMRQYHRDFVHRVRSDRFSPCVTAVPHRRRTSEHVQAFDHEGTLMNFRWVLHPVHNIKSLCILLSVQFLLILQAGQVIPQLFSACSVVAPSLYTAQTS